MEDKPKPNLNAALRFILFRDSVEKMRFLQKLYFKTRKTENLIECKEFEKKVDKLLLQMQKLTITFAAEEGE